VTGKKLSKKRAKLIAELEQIIGRNCYNGNIQNWGPNGVQYMSGRSFRYPLTTLDAEGEKRKTYGKASAADTDSFASGYYAFGANRLHIIQALDEVLQHLENKHGFKL
jgi:hypothetical protein